MTPDPCDNPANGYPNENAKMFINLQGQGSVPPPEWNVNLKGVGNSCAVPFDFNKDGRVDLLTCHYVSHRRTYSKTRALASRKLVYRSA